MLIFNFYDCYSNFQIAVPTAPRDVAVNDSSVCTFPLTPDVRRLEIVSATFGVFIRSSPSTGESVDPSPRGGGQQEPLYTWMMIYRIVRIGDREQRFRIRQKRIEVGNSSSWHQFDFKVSQICVIVYSLFQSIEVI